MNSEFCCLMIVLVWKFYPHSVAATRSLETDDFCPLRHGSLGSPDRNFTTEIRKKTIKVCAIKVDLTDPRKVNNSIQRLRMYQNNVITKLNEISLRYFLFSLISVPSLV